MSIETGISWTDSTRNIIRACRKISPGCARCYAEGMARINPGVLGSWGPNGTRVIGIDAWEKAIAADARRFQKRGIRGRIFINSMADPFEGADDHGRELRTGPRPDYLPALEAIERAALRHPDVILQVLTKRPWNAAIYYGNRDLPRNIHLGASVENQETADERIPELLKIRAHIRFLSCEPLLGPVTLRPEWLNPWAYYPSGFACHAYRHDIPTPPSIKWIIVGCEKVHGKPGRLMIPTWARSLRDQCAAANVPFFLKQMEVDGEVVESPYLDGRQHLDLPE